MKIIGLLGAMLVGSLPMAPLQAASAPQTVSFKSGDSEVRALLYKPRGKGPFPTLLFNHDAARDVINAQTFKLMGPMFAARGWVYFAPYGRGPGAKSDGEPRLVDIAEATRRRGGGAAATRVVARLLSTEELQDQMAALDWLKAQPFVRPSQIAALGSSYGGMATVLGAANGNYCAAVDAAGGADNWHANSSLSKLMTESAQRSMAPILFLQAENDFTIAPSRTLYEAMKAADKPAEIHIYPAYGTSRAEGHSFASLGANIWFNDVMRFLQAHCSPK